MKELILALYYSFVGTALYLVDLGTFVTNGLNPTVRSVSLEAKLIEMWSDTRFYVIKMQNISQLLCSQSTFVSVPAHGSVQSVWSCLDFTFLHRAK